jgi:hypothetical protein
MKKVGSGRAIKTLLVIAGIALASHLQAGAATIASVSIAASPTNVVEGTSVSITANFTDDTPTNAANYTAIFQWGDTSITTNTGGTGISIANGTNITATAAHTYQYASSPTVNVSLVNTDTLANANNSLVLAVADAPLTLVSGGPSSGTEGVFSNQTLLTFSDGNTAATTNDYIVSSYSFGAAVSNITPVIVANGGGQFSVQSDFAYYDEGTNTIQVTVTDQHGGQVVSNSTTIIVGDAPLAIVSTNNLVFTEGIVSNATLLTFNDGNVLVNQDPSDFTALIDWGDGSAIDTNPVTYVTNNTQFAVTGSHMYAEESTNLVTVTVIDKGGSTITVSGDPAAVVDALLTVVSVDLATPVNGYEPLSVQFTNLMGAALITFSDANTVSYQHPPYQEYKAIIQWGDGTSSMGTVVPTSPNVYAVYGDHIYNSTCTNFTVTVQVNDVGSALATSSVAKTFTLYVQDAQFTWYGPLYIHSKNNAVFNGIVASFSYLDTALGASAFTGTIDWGDSTPYDTNATFVANGNGTYLVLGSHTYQTVNQRYNRYTVTVTVKDSNVCSSPESNSEYLTHVSTFTGLDVQMNPTNMYVVTGVSFTLPVATFTDPALPAGMLSDLTAVIIWDTDIPSEGTSVGVITQNPDGSYLVTGTHTYQENGSHCVSVKVIDALENMSDSGECSTFISAAPVVNPNLGTTYVTTGTSFNDQVATINGSVLPAGLLVKISWGDSPKTTSAGVISSGGIITGSHTYYLDGNYRVSVAIYDASGNLLTNMVGHSMFYASASVRDVTSSLAVVFGQTTMKQYKTSGSGGKGKGPSFTTYYIQKVTILNISGATVTGPFGLVLNTDDLKNLTGMMEDGRQYIPLSKFSLRAKQKMTVTLIYQHIPTIQPVSVLAGPGM